MKKLSTFILVSFIYIFSNAQWVDISPEVNVFLRDVSSNSSNSIIVVGNEGTILKSIDGGMSWKQIDSGIDESLGKIKFITPNIGFILSWGSQGKLLKTIDGGETWNIIETGYSNFRDFTVLDENNLYVLGFQYLIYTTNGGETWELLNDSPPYHTQIQFFQNGIGYIGHYKLFKTIDNGNSWEEIYSPNLEEYEGSPSSFINQNVGFTYWHGLTKFTNNGQIWLGANPEFPELLDLFSVSETTSWGIIKGLSEFEPPSRGIVKINVNGETTTSYSDEVFWLPPDVTLESIKFFNDKGYVVGARGGLLKAVVWKNNSGENYMDTSEMRLDNEPKIYPNPASSEINIEFNYSNIALTRISLVDLTGNLIFSDKFINQNKILLNISDINKGMYILTITTAQKTFSQKIILNK